MDGVFSLSATRRDRNNHTPDYFTTKDTKSTKIQRIRYVSNFIRSCSSCPSCSSWWILFIINPNPTMNYPLETTKSQFFSRPFVSLTRGAASAKKIALLSIITSNPYSSKEARKPGKFLLFLFLFSPGFLDS